MGVLLIATTGMGCKKSPTEKADAKPERVYVSTAELERAHPLARTVRQLEEQAEALQKEKIPPALVSNAPVFHSPLSSTNGTLATDAARNQTARREVVRSALVTLARYSTAVQNTLQRIREAERDELEGIARANSATQETEERTKLEDELRQFLFDEERVTKERDALMRRNAARANLRPGNVLTVARDPETGVPAKEALEAQIEKLRAYDANPDLSKPVVSDEARLTKTLRDQQALLTALRQENTQAVADYDRKLAETIARIYADDLKWVEEQLAKSTRGERTRVQIAELRRELNALINNLSQTAVATTLPNGRAITPAPAALPALVLQRPVQTDLLRRLSKERRDLQTTIRADVVNAVRDAGLAHNLEPVFTPAYNLPNKTADFRTWIFRNVPQNTLSNNTK